MHHADSTAVISRIRQYLSSKMAEAEPYTIQEYFTVLLDRAARSLKAGDFGVGAALVVQYDDVELISLGQNTAISQRDPFGHAEMNAIKFFRWFQSLDSSDQTSHVDEWNNAASAISVTRNLFVRPAKSRSQAISTLYTTLEPCPMCTVATMNAHIERVVIANSDEFGGMLAPDRLVRLPRVWPQLAKDQQLDVTFLDSGHSTAFASIPLELGTLLREVFTATKEQCHAEIERGVLFDPKASSAINQVLRRVQTSPDPRPSCQSLF